MNALAIFFFVVGFIVGTYDHTGLMLSCWTVAFVFLLLNPKNKRV